MKVYRLTKTQVLPISLEEAWNFFSTPLNLQEITPEDMSFNILSDIKGVKMFAGQIINYKVSPFPLVSLRWTTEISHVEEGKYFVDEQRFGPYAFWHHKHFFEEVDGGVLATDVVDYALPLGVLGQIANWMFVAKKLDAIFDFRYEKLETLFGKRGIVEKAA